MTNFGIAVAKLVVLAGGALAGAFLSRWVDEMMVAQHAQGVDHHKTRYAQGLVPLNERPQGPQIIRVIEDEQQEW